MPDGDLSATQVSELLHAALHEIAGPAGQIHRIAALVQRRGESLDEELRAWLCHMGAATARLDESLRALRRYTDALELPHERSRFSLLRAAASARKALPPELDIHVHQLPEVEADPKRVELVLRELLNNASRFRSGDVCEIEVSAAREGEDVVVSVADNGIGIEPQQTERIFKPFVRLWGDRFPGAGIGLAIARMLVGTWRGRIWVGPAAQQGSVFRFTVPAPVEKPPSAT
jgi:signal transduction histidine kinase